ncbi:MAG: type II toxin-antitoxin system Phd/YefM family antitoxin [Oscillospiraceae bacterium]|jgi:PHD/YefM family antitoxin component YafN of YafNO toxin-antitoxin module|nr:type II toxin-antitoxin system Phd/YefM family antitoxin [Oscillospiraceae bacterium]
MPQIIPIRDLKKTSEVSQLCHSVSEPIFVTKNGYGDMVLMSMETFEKALFMQDVYRKIAAAEQSIQDGRTMDASESMRMLREKYGV